MNIDILNAHCGPGHSPDHACLRVGWLAIVHLACAPWAVVPRPASRRDGVRRLKYRLVSSVGTASRKQSQGGVGLSAGAMARMLSHESVSRRLPTPACGLASVGVCQTNCHSSVRSQDRGRKTNLFFRPEIRRDYPLWAAFPNNPTPRRLRGTTAEAVEA